MRVFSSRRVLLSAALLLSVLGPPACKSTPVAARTSPVPTGIGTLAQARQYLTGKWTLLSMDIFPPGEAAIHDAMTGSLVYDEYANMTVELHLKPDTAELASRIGIPVSDGSVITTGRTVIDMNNHSLSYVLQGQPPVRPSTHPLDINRPRYWEVNGDTLTLRTRDTDGKVLSVSVWKKG
jgi:hypothetical protein